MATTMRISTRNFYKIYSGTGDLIAQTLWATDAALVIAHRADNAVVKCFGRICYTVSPDRTVAQTTSDIADLIVDRAYAPKRKPLTLV